MAGLSLRVRLIVLVLLVAAPGLLLADREAQETHQHAMAQLQDRALRLARRAALDQQAPVEGMRQLLSTLAAMPTVRDGVSCGAVLDAALTNAGYHWIRVVDEQGHALCGASTQEDNAGQPWFARLQHDSGFEIGGLQVDAATGRRVTMATLILPPGSRARMLAVAVDLDWLTRRLISAEAPDATLTLVDRTGLVLARHPDGERWSGMSAAHVAAVVEATRNGLGAGIGRGLRGDERAYGYAPLGDSGAVVLASLPIEAATAKADRAYYAHLAWVALITLGLLVAVILAAERLVLRPLARLAAAARALSRGNLHARAGLPHGPDEIGQLARSFDGMAEAVERMVLERTEALRDGQERFKLAMRFAPLVVFSHDAELRYTWIHGRQLSAPAQDWLGRTDFDMFEEADAQRLTALKRRALDEGIGVRESIVLHLPEEQREYDFTIEPLHDDSGKVSGLLCAALDQTAERRRQAELDAARAEAERANQDKTRFLAAASHDLRQPLQAMNLYLHLLSSKLTTDEQRNIATYLTQSAQAATSLFDTLMALSALETGQVRPRIQPTDVAPLLQRIAGESRAEAEAKGLRIHVRASPAEIATDPVLLERMVRNLVKNAIRYTDSGRILLAARSCGDGCRIEVRDTGRGIPEEKLQAIFQDFYQLPGARPPGERGLGLGLSTVARMGRLLGHETGVRSRVGHGSVFFIRVPRAGRRLAA